ncbi:hypothetical protein T552_01989 [Pneumocystis carinii B80]|uniref:Large ribosomal subunit protein eL14 domain-containing protein n=1 Tax=Pneumocystis carinii (strain B80) TaxID=1408658 RepID=A0A0W4ZID8_PNEC8|nr:hypothetical protein T552_01989 [Pneumocystis carinii B80]KTW28130.1 hypothetical protein T552_01989 [Pneumocystis carinii B80]
MLNRPLFKNNVEIGRVVLFIDGKYKGNAAVIVEVLNRRNVIVDGPKTNVPRHVASLNNLIFSSIVIQSLSHGARTGIVAKRWDSQDISTKWNATRLVKKLEARRRRSELNDFERFQVILLKKQRRREVTRALVSN